jgi:hypothetical protein
MKETPAMKCPRCKKAATVENEMFCAHPLCPLPIPTTNLSEANMAALKELAAGRGILIVEKK